MYVGRLKIGNSKPPSAYTIANSTLLPTNACAIVPDRVVFQKLHVRGKAEDWELQATVCVSALLSFPCLLSKLAS